MRYNVILLIIVAAFFVTSCEKDPTDIGSNLLPPGDFINLITVNSTTDNWEQNSKSFKGVPGNFGRSEIILLGKHSGILSSILISNYFILPDSIFTALKADSLNVLSAWIEFHPYYTWGDTNSTFNLTAYKINSYWQHNNFNSDSLSLLDFDANNIASQIQLSDSLLKFNIDKNVVQGWLKARVDSTLPKNYGILIKPEQSDDKIIGFAASNGIEFGNIPELKVKIEKPGSFIDTLSTTITREDVHVVEGNLLTVNSDKILLQDGIAGRGFLMIDLSLIPAKSIVNKADLSLHIDSLLTEFGKPLSDSIEVALYRDSLNLQVIDSTVRPIYLTRNGNTFTGDIHKLLQLIVDGKPNNGFRLKLTNEKRAMDRVVLDGSTTNVNANKPKLTITYTAIK